MELKECLLPRSALQLQVRAIRLVVLRFFSPRCLQPHVPLPPHPPALVLTVKQFEELQWQKSDPENKLASSFFFSFPQKNSEVNTLQLNTLVLNVTLSLIYVDLQYVITKKMQCGACLHLDFQLFMAMSYENGFIFIALKEEDSLYSFKNC